MDQRNAAIGPEGRRKVRRTIKRVDGGVGRPSRRPTATRRRDRSSGIAAKTVLLLATVDAATGTADAYTPETGESPVYYPVGDGSFTYDESNTVPWEWWSSEAVDVSSGKGRIAHVIGRKLFPLCMEIDLP